MQNRSNIESNRVESNRVNDFAFKIATANGTGSASANGLIMQAIFRMGVPVTGKNVFPSNIQGLPTWYEIRVNKNGYTARTPHFDLMVALNAATYAKDVAEVRSGGYLMFDSSWPLDDKLKRPDITYIGVPLAEMCNAAFKGVRERILMKNIAYAGALAALIGMDTEIVAALTKEKYAAKKALLDSNEKAIALGYDYVKAHFECPLPIHLEKMDATKDSILIDGNTAAALGAVFAGATVGAWYPITPATSVMEAFKSFCMKFRRDPETKQKKFAILQAEDELAALGMVVGASWAGARAFTPTAGPGISLMNEFIGLAYYAEIPAVIVDVQRTGPSTGMPTRTQQGDLMLCAYASHGDTRHICLYPADPREAFEFGAKAFDLAERFQTPMFLVTDLDIGMNDWMVPKLNWDDTYKPDRGKVLSAEDLEKAKNFWRYYDHDGDGIPQRSLPGVHPKGAYFTRGSGHNKYGGYTEDADEYQEVLDRVAPQDPGRDESGARSRVIKHDAGREDGPGHGRRLPRGVRRGDGPARQGRHRAQLHARARLPVRRRGAAVPRAARGQFHRRAEPRRAAAQPAHARPRRAHREAGIGPLLRGLPDERAPRDQRREGEAGEGGMTYIAKPKVHHPSLKANAIGLTRRDYEGAITTLCAGCGHDSITAAIIQAFWELSIPPHKVAKLSGIGCSSKTPAYFLREAHGFNSVHGRMPAVATGANAANGDLIMIGVSGDGDSLSIGLGQLCHAIRRNVNMLYVLENNGVYGLTKGQFSASADPGSTAQEGRSQHHAGDRRRADGADARRHLRRAQLLGRQGPAGADHPGRHRASRASRSST